MTRLLSPKALAYYHLFRLHKPVGTLLILWPTLASLWLAAGDLPDWQLIIIFSLGSLIMRSAGCAINDYADRDFDGDVTRTKDRPLATGALSPKEAMGAFLLLALIAFGLVLMLNRLTIYLSLIGLFLAASYPFFKRFTNLPQVYLGLAMNWGIIMAYAAQKNTVDFNIGLLFIATICWTIAYDTFYAMVDRDDDLKLGLNSTAILFGQYDRLITAIFQILCVTCLIATAVLFELSFLYGAAVVMISGLFAYQQWLIKSRDRDNCFKAFLNNNHVGWVLLVGIILGT